MLLANENIKALSVEEARRAHKSLCLHDGFTNDKYKLPRAVRERSANYNMMETQRKKSTFPSAFHVIHVNLFFVLVEIVKMNLNHLMEPLHEL